MAVCSSAVVAISANNLASDKFPRKFCIRRVSALFSARGSCPVTAVRASSDDVKEPSNDTLVSEFMRYVNAAQQTWPYEGRKPTALMPPNTVVKVQMDSLMRNDWPDEDSGIKTAFKFCMPPNVEDMLAGQIPESASTARAWNAAERYLTFSQFSELLRDPMYAPLINFADWTVASPVVFHGPGDIRALQCVKITYQSVEGKEASRSYTFCLQKVKHGTYRNCWMVVGVRRGDYANV